jgi:hypothetical protein
VQTDYWFYQFSIKRFITMTLCCLFYVQSANSSAVKQYQGELSFLYQDYMDGVGGVEGNRWWSDFNFSYEKKEPFIDDEAKVDFTFRYNDADGFFYSVREAQYTLLGNFSEISMGFIIIDWSEVDKIWGLGKINNRVNIDFFDPGLSGLPGILYNQRLSKNFAVSIFGTYLYVPEYNPALKINKAQRSITTRSPWVIPPATTTTVDGDPVSIRYDVVTPDVAEIVFNYSYGLNLKYSFTEYLHLTTYYVRKPENSLSNTATVLLSNNDFNADVKVTPNLYYHDLWGGQLTWETPSKSWQFYTSYLMSQPGSKPQNTDSVIYGGYAFRLEKQDEEYWGTGIKYTFYGGYAHLGHIARVSGFEETPILKRPRWGEAVNFSIYYELFTSLAIKTELFYDYSSYDRMLEAELKYTYNQVLALAIGANILTSPDGGVGFWAPFRQNDGVYTELSILF